MPKSIFLLMVVIMVLVVISKSKNNQNFELKEIQFISVSIFPKCCASGFLFAQHGQTPEGLKEILTPNQKEVNATASALLATAGCEGSLSKG